MKKRLVVMNGQRIVQSEQFGEWVNEKIQRAGPGVKPGIYDLYLSVTLANDSEAQGVIIHTDKEHIYQYLGSKIIKYEVKDFDKKITLGSEKTIYRQANGDYKVS